MKISCIFDALNTDDFIKFCQCLSYDLNILSKAIVSFVNCAFSNSNLFILYKYIQFKFSEALSFLSLFDFLFFYGQYIRGVCLSHWVDFELNSSGWVQF